MPRAEDRPPRGAADLAERWAALPVGVADWPLRALPQGAGLGPLSDGLRGRAWREHCRAATLPGRGVACADAGTACQGNPSARCTADALFPLGVGGGTPAWRMASLFLRWHPAAGLLRLLALGEAAVPALDWAVQAVQRSAGLPGPQAMRVRALGDLFLPPAPRWRIDFVTPWVAAKVAARSPLGTPAPAPMADAQALHHELCEAMISRAHKLTALACRDADAQRLGGHLAHYVGRALLPGALRVARADLEPVDLPAESRGNRQAYTYRAWVGQAELDATPAALPWLSLLALCGGGANADKGFGVVEFTPD
jgi:hypothetical protein